MKAFSQKMIRFLLPTIKILSFRNCLQSVQHLFQKVRAANNKNKQAGKPYLWDLFVTFNAKTHFLSLRSQFGERLGKCVWPVQIYCWVF